MKRKRRLRKSSRTPLAQAKKNLWKELKVIVHKRDYSRCISCGAKNLEGTNRQGGHFIPSASCGGFLRYDLRNVWTQCAKCNLFHSGAGAEYTVALQNKFSKSFVDRIIKDKQVTIKLDLDYIMRLTEHYQILQDKKPRELMDITKTYKGFK